MPYKRRGRIVYVKKAGAWRKKATAATVAKAKRMMSILQRAKARKKKRVGVSQREMKTGSKT